MLSDAERTGSALPSAVQADGPTSSVVGPPTWNCLFEDLVPVEILARAGQKDDECEFAPDATTEGGRDDACAA